MKANISELKVVNGVNVEYQHAGSTHIVTVKELTIRKLFQFVRHASDGSTPDLVALACDKPVEWVDTLPNDVFGRLASIAMRLNFSQAMTIAMSGDEVMASLIKPVMAKGAAASELYSEIFQRVKEKLQKQSPEPAPSDSAPATGSESSTATPPSA